MNHADEMRQISDGLRQMQYTVSAQRLCSVFDMNAWIGNQEVNVPDPNNPDFDCGFAGCAIGWSPKFAPTIGLSFVYNPQDKRWMVAYETPMGLFLDYQAVAVYFDITTKQATRLFSPGAYDEDDSDRYISPGEVADRIEDFLEIHA